MKEYREQEQQVIAMKRAARKAGTFYVEPEARVLFSQKQGEKVKSKKVP